MPSEPLTLAFDTSAAHCAAALLSGDRLLAARHVAMSTGQAERLFPLLEGLLLGCGADWRDLTRIGVGTGPGNFTGIRISVAAARGLALSLGVPAIGVTGFEALANGLPRPAVALIGAPRGRLYVQRFTADGAEAPALADPAHPGSGWPAEAEVRVADPAAEAILGGLAVPLPGRPVAPLHPLAEAVARIAAAADAAAAPLPAPVYLRPADAAPPSGAPPVVTG